MVSGAVDAALLRHDLWRRRVDMLADHVGALVDQRCRSGALLDRIVPGARVDHRDRGVRIHLLRPKRECVHRPVDDAERVGRHEAQLAGLGHRPGGHAAQVLAFVGASIDGFEVGAIGGTGRVHECHVGILGSQFLEGIGVAERGADDYVRAALDELLGRRPDGRGVFRYVFDELDLLAERRLDLDASLVEGLGPATVILGPEVQHCDFRLVLQGETVGRRRETRHAEACHQRRSDAKN